MSKIRTFLWENIVNEIVQDAADSIGQERRLEARGATVFRPVLIETEDFAGFCLVRNLSSRGLRGKVYTTFAPRQPITVQFTCDELVRGTLIWCKDNHIGVTFAQPVDVPRVLANLAQKEIDGRINRSLRLPIQCAGELLIDGRAHRAEVQDISQRGLKVLTSFVRPGEELTVVLEGLERRKAIVRWSQAGMAGLNFLRALSFGELAGWVVERQMGQDRHPDIDLSEPEMIALVAGGS
jgi:hypothetical protein